MLIFVDKSRNPTKDQEGNEEEKQQIQQPPENDPGQYPEHLCGEGEKDGADLDEEKEVLETRSHKPKKRSSQKQTTSNTTSPQSLPDPLPARVLLAYNFNYIVLKIQ